MPDYQRASRTNNKILQVPIAINFGAEVLKTGIDIDDNSFFALVDKEGKLPTTSTPSPGDFSDTFAQALRAGAGMIGAAFVAAD
jgi:fatty acid-binding protein DegV